MEWAMSTGHEHEKSAQHNKYILWGNIHKYNISLKFFIADRQAMQHMNLVQLYGFVLSENRKCEDNTRGD